MKRSYRSLIAVVAAILSFGLFLTACSDDDVASTGANGDEAEQDHDDHGETPVAEGARRIDVNATSFAYDPDEITVDTGEDVAIVLTYFTTSLSMNSMCTSPPTETKPLREASGPTRRASTPTTARSPVTGKPGWKGPWWWRSPSRSSERRLRRQGRQPWRPPTLQVRS